MNLKQANLAATKQGVKIEQLNTNTVVLSKGDTRIALKRTGAYKTQWYVDHEGAGFGKRFPTTLGSAIQHALELFVDPIQLHSFAAQSATDAVQESYDAARVSASDVIHNPK